MDANSLDTIAGLLLTAACLVLVGGLVWWARRSINRIARGGYGTAREILRGPRRDG